MGNSFSCSLALSKQSRPRMSYLFDTQGRLHRVELPMTVSNLPVDTRENIVCPVDVLQRKRVIWALHSDEQLEPEKVYMMFPAERVYGKVSESELAVIMAASKKKKNKKGVTLVLPPLEKEEKVEFSSQCDDQNRQ